MKDRSSQILALFPCLLITVSMLLFEGTNSRDVSVAFRTRLAIGLCVVITVVLGFCPSLLLQLTNPIALLTINTGAFVTIQEINHCGG
jgi:hypothetical protein